MVAASPSQIRAARAILRWTILDLAKAANLSISTVKRFEDGGLNGSSGYVAKQMRAALEAEGVCFLTDDAGGMGVTHRPPTVSPPLRLS